MEEKHAGGRPLAFKTTEELQFRIDEYFDYCDNHTKRLWNDKKAEELLVSNPEPYTISGLAYYLGIDRKTINNYQDRDEFFPTIKRAKARVEADIERRMNDKDTFTPGLIFNAKNNFGWKDEQKLDHTTNGKDLPTPILGGVSNVHTDDSTK